MANEGDDAPGDTFESRFLNTSLSVDEETSEAEARGAFSSTAPMHIDVLKISSEDLARQITILDSAAFRSIRVEEELRNGAWLGKDKFERAPHVVDCTRRFNHVAFWITREILQAASQVERVDRLVHFIKVAKKLHDHNNMHGLLAVVSGLKSAPIYRLSQTWKCLGEKYVSRFEKLEKLVSEAENYKQLREHLTTTKLPCIPYLGMYLTDLMHLGSQSAKTAAILEEVARFQHSEYTFDVVSFIREYLLGVRYREELLKLIEKDNYRISLTIEPKAGASESESPVLSSQLLDQLATLPPKGSVPARIRPPRAGHRKVKSLGSSTMFGSFASRQSLLTGPEDEGASLTLATPLAFAEPAHPVPRTAPAPAPRTAPPPPPPRAFTPPASPVPAGLAAAKPSPLRLANGMDDDEGSASDEDLDASLALKCRVGVGPTGRVEKEGMLRRRTSSRLWPVKRQWVQLAFPNLILYSSARSGSRSERSAYKLSPSCVLALDHADVEADPTKPEFRIILGDAPDDSLRFIADGIEDRDRWVRAVQRALAGAARSARGSMSVAPFEPLQAPFRRHVSSDFA